MEKQYTFDENILSDLHKDAYGFRPREEFFAHWDTLTNDQKEEFWNKMCDDLRAEDERERAMQRQAESDLEDRIKFIISTCSCMRSDAIRYLHDAYKTNGDESYLEFNLGVRYGYLSGKVNPLYA